MMYLLDTNVVSESRKVSFGKSRPARINSSVASWLGSVSAASLYISSITLMELEIGCLLLTRRDFRQGSVLRSWIDNQVLPAFAGRVLAVDTQVALRAAALHVPNPSSDRDSLIAATALVHGMTVVTRNTSDFESSGVKLLNPWTPQHPV